MISTMDEEQAAPATARESGEHGIIVFDIETGPAPLAEISISMPEFTAPANYKDAVKIAANIAEQRERYIEKAALNPMTGRVIAIGAWVDGEYRAHICEDAENAERDCLQWFWGLIGRRSVLIGFNSNSFDLPFLMRRSWALGIVTPTGLTDRRMGFSPPRCWDLMDVWRLGDRNMFISLDNVSRFLSIGEKTQDGEFFHKLVRVAPEEAAEYLENDVFLTFELARRLGVINGDVEFRDYTTTEATSGTPEPEDY